MGAPPDRDPSMMLPKMQDLSTWTSREDHRHSLPQRRTLLSQGSRSLVASHTPWPNHGDNHSLSTADAPATNVRHHGAQDTHVLGRGSRSSASSAGGRWVTSTEGLWGGSRSGQPPRTIPPGSRKLSMRGRTPSGWPVTVRQPRKAGVCLSLSCALHSRRLKLGEHGGKIFLNTQ